MHRPLSGNTSYNHGTLIETTVFAVRLMNSILALGEEPPPASPFIALCCHFSLRRIPYRALTGISAGDSRILLLCCS